MNTRRLFALATLVSLPAWAANWPQWRGPTFNGSSDEKNPPTSFSKTDNIAWSLDLPGPAASTPVIWEDTVLVSTTDTSAQSLLAMGVDRKTGRVLWKNKIAEAYRRDDRSNFASPSPATDGKHAVFFYGNGELVSFDLKGEKQWSKNVQKEFGEFAFQWTFSTSPLIAHGKLYLQVLQRDVPVNGRGRKDGPNESSLIAMDLDTGKTLWRSVRPSEAVAESREAFSTPVPFEHNGRPEILIAGGDAVTGHDPGTGAELWRWATWNPDKITHWRFVPSPVAGAGIVLVCAPKGSPAYAVKAGGKGRLDDSQLAWKSTDNRAISSDVPTPAFYDGDFILLSDVKKSISRVEPATGKARWTVELPGRAKFEASPTVVDGKAYLLNFAGDVAVVDVQKGALISGLIPMGEAGDDMTRSVIPVSHQQLFVRTNSKLYCVGTAGR